MKIIFVGVPCVGTSTVGKLLAEQVGYKFFDFPFEVEKYFDSHITFLKQRWPWERTYRENVHVVLQKILNENEDDFIIAMPASGLMDFFWRIIKKDEDLVTIVLRDRAHNILKRITFYDDYSQLMEYKLTERMKEYYLKEIRADMEYFGRSFPKAKIQYQIKGKSAAEVVEDLKNQLFGEEIGSCKAQDASKSPG